MQRLTTLSALLAACAVSTAAAGVTRAFTRQRAAPSLSLGEVRRLMGGRRLEAAAEQDPVEQVHLMGGVDGSVVVVFMTEQRGMKSSVIFGTGGSLDKKAEGKVRSYAQLLCPTSEYHVAPPMGEVPLSGLALEDLVSRVNTSAFSPEDSAQHFKLKSASDAWDSRSNGCLDYKNPHAYWVSKYVHTVTLPNLKPQTKYTYRPEAGTRQFTFATPPAIVDDSKPIRIGLTADVGTTNVSRAVLMELLGSELDFFFLVGDYSYADGLADRWDAFGILAEPLMSTVPHISVPGNHEISEGREQGRNWEMRYPVPYTSDSPWWYSYEVGPVHVVGLAGSYAPTGAGSPQHEFLKEDLAAVDRTRTPWVVVLFHTPWYNSNTHHFREGFTAQQDMEAILYKHGVDLVVNGHIHAYERSHPVFNNTIDSCGITHLVVGDGGNYEGPVTGWTQPQPAWSAFREASFGAGVLEVHNSTHAIWQWRRAACVVAAGNKANGEGKFFVWNGDGAPNGANCSTSGDDSDSAYETSDEVVLVRDVKACPSRAGSRRLQATNTFV